MQLSLKRRENLEQNTCAVTFDSFYFCWGLCFVFCCVEDVTTVTSSLCSVQEPSEALMESEEVHDIAIPSAWARR